MWTRCFHVAIFEFHKPIRAQRHFGIYAHTFQVSAKEKLDALVCLHQNNLEICKVNIFFLYFPS